MRNQKFFAFNDKNIMDGAKKCCELKNKELKVDRST